MFPHSLTSLLALTADTVALVSDVAEPPFVLRKSSAAATDETAAPSIPGAG